MESPTQPESPDYLEGADEVIEAERALANGGGMEAGMWLVYARTRYAKTWFYMSEADEIAQREIQNGRNFADVQRDCQSRQKLTHTSSANPSSAEQEKQFPINMEKTHPTEEELSQYAQFQLPVDHAKAVGEHLRNCSECNSRYRDKHQHRPGAPPVPDRQ
jgi:hypothetical protein